MSARIWAGSQKAQGQNPGCGQDEIAGVAYQLYETRGREDGHALEDWLKAEAIVQQRASQVSVRAANGRARQRT